MYIYIYIYTYIERERDTHIYTYIYIYAEHIRKLPQRGVREGQVLAPAVNFIMLICISIMFDNIRFTSIDIVNVTCFINVLFV